MRVRASGRMYDGNTLVLNMTYDGEAETNEHTYTIKGDDIRMVAQRN